jgi:hypothetical protein
MKAQKQVQERIKFHEDRIKKLDLQISEKINELRVLQSSATMYKDRLAAIKDARGGIYDKWYRHHREDNFAYDTQWEAEKERMLSEGYEGEFKVVEG